MKVDFPNHSLPPKSVFSGSFKPKISILRPPWAKIQRFYEVTNYGQLSAN